MLETTNYQNPTQFVFRPLEKEKNDLITNDYLLKMSLDENLRYELIGGELIVSKAPRFIHQLLATRIIGEFLEVLRKNPVGEILATPGLIFSEFDGVIPDLIYISHERIKEILDEDDGKFYGAPCIVIEVLSPGRSNARRDMQIKRELYEVYEVPEYWIVDPFEKRIVVFRREENRLKESKIYGENEILETTVLPELKLEISRLFGD